MGREDMMRWEDKVRRGEMDRGEDVVRREDAVR